MTKSSVKSQREGGERARHPEVVAHPEDRLHVLLSELEVLDLGAPRSSRRAVDVVVEAVLVRCEAEVRRDGRPVEADDLPLEAEHDELAIRSNVQRGVEDAHPLFDVAASELKKVLETRNVSQVQRDVGAERCRH